MNNWIYTLAEKIDDMYAEKFCDYSLTEEVKSTLQEALKDLISTDEEEEYYDAWTDDDGQHIIHYEDKEKSAIARNQLRAELREKVGLK